MRDGIKDLNDLRQFALEQAAKFRRQGEERRERIYSYYPDLLSDLGYSDFSLEFSEDVNCISMTTLSKSRIKQVRCECKEGDLMSYENTIALNDIFQTVKCIDTVRNGDAYLLVINKLRQMGFYGIRHDYRIENNTARLRLIASKMEVKFEITVLYDETSPHNAVSQMESTNIDFDSMDGYQFEQFCASLLRSRGYEDVAVTQGSGDQGIDIIAYRDGIKYGIQCKCYNSPVGNKSVQEVFAGKTFYQCHVGIVITNNYFTSSATELARQNGIILWNRDKLQQMIDESR